ncbi:uncharacterized protein [Phyllobates terribilis]|uniref:uncharacterized protein isoform X2 n=1 Tax=Phyllobates terribilis TaxID=111132 RepID=UPI003CCB2DE7
MYACSVSKFGRGAGNNAGTMAAGYWGRPRYNFSRPPMNYRGNMPHPNRPFHYGQFTENTEMHSDSFVVGLFSEPFDSKQVMWNKKKYKKKNLLVHQMPQKPQKKGASVNQQPQTSGGAAKNPQQHQKKNPSQSKPSGDADKNPKQRKKNAFRNKVKKLRRAAKKLQNSQAQASVAKNPQQPKTPVVSKTKSPQQPKTPVDSQQANAEVKQEKQTTTQNGGATGETKDADVPTPPHKKLKTEESILPEDLPIHGWRGDTSTMFSCSLCRYYTPDEREMQIHFYSSQHKEVMKHLYIFYPKQRVDFLHNYLLFKKRKMSMEQKSNNNLQPVIRDKFKGIGQEHFLHRIQAAQCQACNVLIPDVPELLSVHIKSDVHQQNCKVTLKNIKVNSLAAARELLLDKEVLQMLKIYISGKNPFKDTASCPSKVSGTPEVLVAEEDDEDVVFNADDDDHHHHLSVDDTDDNDTIADAEVGEEVPADKGSGSIMSVNTEKTVKEEETDEDEEEAAEAP